MTTVPVALPAIPRQVLNPTRMPMSAWRHIGTITEPKAALEMFCTREILPAWMCDPQRFEVPDSMQTLAMLAADPVGVVTAMQFALEAHPYIHCAAPAPRISWEYGTFRLPLDSLTAFGILGNSYAFGLHVREDALPFGHHFPASVLGPYTRYADDHHRDPHYLDYGVHLPMRLDTWMGAHGLINAEAVLDGPRHDAILRWNETWLRECRRPPSQFPSTHACRAYVALRVAAKLAPQTPFWRALLSVWELGYAVRELSPTRIVLFAPQT